MCQGDRFFDTANFLIISWFIPNIAAIPLSDRLDFSISSFTRSALSDLLALFLRSLISIPFSAKKRSGICVIVLAYQKLPCNRCEKLRLASDGVKTLSEAKFTLSVYDYGQVAGSNSQDNKTNENTDCPFCSLTLPLSYFQFRHV